MHNIPLVILNSWDELDENKLNYDDYSFDDNVFNEISNLNYIKKILSKNII